MRAIFDTSKTLAKVPSTKLDPTKRPVRFRENLAKELTSNEPNRSSSSSSKPQSIEKTATTSTSSSSQAHTSPNREVTLADDKDAGERLRLDYVDRNINWSWKNALIIEKQTAIQDSLSSTGLGRWTSEAPQAVSGKVQNIAAIGSWKSALDSLTGQSTRPEATLPFC